MENSRFGFLLSKIQNCDGVLEISGYELNDEEMKEIANSIKTNLRIQSFTFKDNQITEIGGQYLFQIVKEKNIQNKNFDDLQSLIKQNWLNLPKTYQKSPSLNSNNSSHPNPQLPTPYNSRFEQNKQFFTVASLNSNNSSQLGTSPIRISNSNKYTEKTLNPDKSSLKFSSPNSSQLGTSPIKIPNSNKCTENTFNKSPPLNPDKSSLKFSSPNSSQLGTSPIKIPNSNKYTEKTFNKFPLNPDKLSNNFSPNSTSQLGTSPIKVDKSLNEPPSLNSNNSSSNSQLDTPSNNRSEQHKKIFTGDSITSNSSSQLNIPSPIKLDNSNKSTNKLLNATSSLHSNNSSSPNSQLDTLSNSRFEQLKKNFIVTSINSNNSSQLGTSPIKIPNSNKFTGKLPNKSPSLNPDKPSLNSNSSPQLNTLPIKLDNSNNSKLLNESPSVNSNKPSLISNDSSQLVTPPNIIDKSLNELSSVNSNNPTSSNILSSSNNFISSDESPSMPPSNVRAEQRKQYFTGDLPNSKKSTDKLLNETPSLNSNNSSSNSQLDTPSKNRSEQRKKFFTGDSITSNSSSQLNIPSPIKLDNSNKSTNKPLNATSSLHPNNPSSPNSQLDTLSNSRFEQRKKDSSQLGTPPIKVDKSLNELPSINSDKLSPNSNNSTSSNILSSSNNFISSDESPSIPPSNIRAEQRKQYFTGDLPNSKKSTDKLLNEIPSLNSNNSSPNSQVDTPSNVRSEQRKKFFTGDSITSNSVAFINSNKPVPTSLSKSPSDAPSIIRSEQPTKPTVPPPPIPQNINAIRDLNMADAMDSLIQSIQRLAEERKLLSGIYKKNLIPFLERWKKVLARQIISEKDQKIIESVISRDRIEIAIVGHNNSGKSMLINCLLGKKICVVENGKTTCRIMIIRYGEGLPTGKFRVWLEDEKRKISEMKITDSFQGLVDFQTRPNSLERQFVSQKIYVEMDHPLLKSGISLVDMPGLEETEIISDLVSTYLKEKNPLVIFVDHDPGFLDSSFHSLQTVKNLGLTPMLFISNKFDEDLKDEEEIVPQLINRRIGKRYENWKEKIHTFPELLLDQVRKAQFFSCISAREVFRKNENTAKVFIDLHDEFLRKLEFQIINGILSELEDSSKKMELALYRVFSFNDIKIDPPTVQSLKDKAMQYELKLYKKLQNHVSDVTEQLQIKLSEALTKDQKEKLTNESIDIPLDEWENKYLSQKDIEKPIQLFEKQLFSRIISRIFRNAFFWAINELVEKTKMELNQIFENEKELLNREIIYYTIHNIYNNVKPDIEATVDEDSMKSINTYSPSNLINKLVSIPFKSVLSGVMNNTTISTDFKKKRAASFLKKLDFKEIATSFTSFLKQALETNHQSFRDDLENQLPVILEVKKKCMFKDFISELALIQCRIFAWRDLKFGYPQIKIEKHIGHVSQCGKIMQATWLSKYGNKNLAIKIPNEDMHAKHSNRIYLEIVIHNSSYNTIKNVSPFLGVAIREKKLLFDKKPEFHMVMEEMKCDLSKLLEENKIFTEPSERIRLAFKIAECVEGLHKQIGIIHRDLKPDNILISENYEIYLTDFGVSQLIGYSNSVTGSVGYIAPEILNNRKIPKMYNEKVDIFSFGILMWALWPGNKLNLINERTKLPIPATMKLYSSYMTLMIKCWNEDPEKRPENFTKIKEELNKILNE